MEKRVTLLHLKRIGSVYVWREGEKRESDELDATKNGEKIRVK